MSFLNKVKTGVQQTAYMTTLYGPPGVGKTTFISNIPNVLVFDIESGSKNVDLARLSTEDIPDYAALVSATNELLTTTHSYKALAIDSVTSLEYYINKQVCSENGNVKELSEIPFGKGVHFASEKLKDYLSILNDLKNRVGMDIWLVGHSKINKFSDPTLMNQYDRFTLQASEKLGQEIIRQSDDVYFVKYEVDVTVDKNTKKARGVSDGSVRMMHTRFNAAFEAKTRQNLPEVLPFKYETFVDAITNYGPKSSDEVKKDILALITKLQPHDADFAGLAKDKLTSAGADNQKLQRIKEKLLDATKAL